MSTPIIRSARTRKRYKAGRYEAALLDQIVTVGRLVAYEYIIVVFEKTAEEPFFLVTSERNDAQANAELFRELGLEPEMLASERGGTHFLCVFSGGVHQNLGDSNEWAEIDRFEAAALNILTKELGQRPKAVQI